MNRIHQPNAHFSDLLSTVKQLLGENGCPWDKRQTNESLLKHLTSEMEEVVQAIKNKDHENLCEELGDLLYLIALISEINQREGFFSIDTVITLVNDKLIRRHPHVFAGTVIKTDEELRSQWLAIKALEKSQK